MPVRLPKYRVAFTLPDGTEREAETCTGFTQAVMAAAEHHKSSGRDIRLEGEVEPGRQDEIIISRERS